MAAVCRLCILSSSNFKSFLNNNGEFNEIYKIAVKYLNPMFLQAVKGHNSTVICIECFRKIMDFHQFYVLIINSQSTLDYEKPINDYVQLEKQKLEDYTLSCNPDAVVYNEIQLSSLDEIDIKEELSEFNIFHINETNDNITTTFANNKKDINIVPKIYQCNLCEKCFENFRALEEHICQINNDDESEQYHQGTSGEIQMLEEETNKTPKQIETEIQQSKISLKIPNLRIRKLKENDDFIAGYKGELECTICKETFTSYTTLNNHFLISHPNQECHIFCCKKKFNKRWKLVAHLQQFHKPTDNGSCHCSLCGATFSEYGNLRRHIRKKHPTQSHLHKWLCTYCNKMFRKRTSLEQHKQLEHSNQIMEGVSNGQSNFIERPDKKQDFIIKKSQKNVKQTIAKNEVELSYNSFASIENIQIPSIDIIDVKEELSIDSDNEPMATQLTEFNDLSCSSDEIFICSDSDSNTDEYDFKEINNVCDLYKDKNVLKYDNIIAKWKKDLECPICKIQIGNFSLLSNHFNTEHPDGKCHIECCQTVLTARLQIIEHLKGHGDDKGFRCDICNKSFTNVRGLESHKRQVHIEKRSTFHSHLCYCKKSNFQENPSSLNVYDTTACCQRKQKILEDDAIIAKWKGDLKCAICMTTFSHYSLLRVHYYYVHPGQRCFIDCCERKFYKLLDAIQHIRVHLDPSAFKCELCDLKFCGKSRLMAHMRRAHGKTVQQKFSCDQCDQTFEHRIILTRHKNMQHTKKF